ncbi:DUF397 domain-containing protein [Micromonospora matsumotoense]|uniref:DUF397 domain-containing protein n=1 Tax=Micromonospora matsumotoense TaxID=121616 RepID=UPI00343E2F6C
MVSTGWADDSGNCVEVADNLPGVVLVRDSKDRAGPTLHFTPDTWRSFVTSTGTAARLKERRACR